MTLSYMTLFLYRVRPPCVIGVTSCLFDDTRIMHYTVVEIQTWRHIA